MARMPRLDALLLLLALGRAHARPTHAQLQAHLLAGYSTADVPNTNRSSRCADLGHLAPDSCATFELGTDVAIEFQFYKLESVDLAKGIMLLRSWLRLTWTDPRLAWNTTEWEHTSTNIPISKLWKPDVSVYNAVTHLQASFTDEDAIVYPSGFVFWSRPGNLQVLCRFSGLVNFPHDRLQCQFDVAAWVLPASSQGLYPKGLVGYKLPEVLASGPISLQSALSSYQAQSITNVSVHYAENTYPSEPNDPYPTLTYTVTLDRNTFFFLNFALLPNVLFALISLGIMFFHVAPNVEGRISLLLTNLLLVVVEKQTVRAYLPICGELLWIDMFFWLNFCVTMLVLLESMLVHALGNSKAPSFLSLIMTRSMEQLIRRWRKQVRRSPAWRWLQARGNQFFLLFSSSPKQRTKALEDEDNGRTRHGGRSRGCPSDDASTQPQGLELAPKSQGDAKEKPPPLTYDEYWHQRRDVDALIHEVEPGKAMKSWFLLDYFRIFGRAPREYALMPEEFWVRVKQDRLVRNAFATASKDCTDPRRLRLFEAMFYQMDVDTKGVVPCSDAAVLLDFCSDLTTVAAVQAAAEADSNDRDGLDEKEFIAMCMNILGDVDEGVLRRQWELYLQYCAAMLHRINAIWIERAMAVDRWFRFYLPIMYGLSLILLYKIKVSDGYSSAEKKTMSRFLFDMDVTLTADMIEFRHLLWWLMMFIVVFGGLFALMILFWQIVAKSISAYLRTIAYRQTAYDVYLKKEKEKLPMKKSTSIRSGATMRKSSAVVPINSTPG
mmetsp:Transcript_18259/g.51382  ORF Transcript_18259/g.51382 Transcript_18259/m.51382 type:complete len:777 (-) Transcript_18259:171-2501(-)